jgi:Fic family protein
MHTFDYSFLKDMMLSSSFATRLARIEGFRSGVRRFSEDHPAMAGDMRELSKIMSTRESNDIEGISTEDSRLLKLLTGNVKPIGHEEYELLGYRDALNRVHDGYGTMEIEEDTVLSLFSTLVSYTGAEPGYKTRNNEIVDRDGSGRIAKRYKTVPASQVKDSMFQLIGAFNEARNDMGVPGILLIPCFIMDFLKIHPFMDGNGRMSRLLTVLLMYQEGLDVCSYVSIEAIINQSKADYYDALARSGEGWFDDINDYLPFMEYMIGVIFLAYKEFDRRLALCSPKDDKGSRVETVLMNVTIPISKSELCALMPDISEPYIEIILSRMCEEGRIEKVGGGRSLRYRPVRPRGQCFSHPPRMFTHEDPYRLRPVPDETHTLPVQTVRGHG